MLATVAVGCVTPFRDERVTEGLQADLPPCVRLVNVPFTVNFVVLCGVQALAVLAPRPSPSWARVRVRPVWGLLPLAGIGGAVVFMGNVEGAAERAVDLAAVATPVLAVLGLLALRLRPLALLVPVLYWVAWQHPGTRAADLSTDALIVLACATLAWGTGIIAPRWAIAVGIVITTAVDVVQILNQDLQPVAEALSRAVPPRGLPRLQEARFAGASMGWGDVYLAALLGVLTGARLRRAFGAAVAVFVVAVLYGFAFLVLDVIPATVPVTAAMLVVALVDRRFAARELVPPRPRRPGRRDSLQAPTRK